MFFALSVMFSRFKLPFILQVRKLRCRIIKGSKWQTQDLNPGSLAPEPEHLSASPSCLLMGLHKIHEGYLNHGPAGWVWLFFRLTIPESDDLNSTFAIPPCKMKRFPYFLVSDKIGWLCFLIADCFCRPCHLSISRLAQLLLLRLASYSRATIWLSQFLIR